MNEISIFGWNIFKKIFFSMFYQLSSGFWTQSICFLAFTVEYNANVGLLFNDNVWYKCRFGDISTVEAKLAESSIACRQQFWQYVRRVLSEIRWIAVCTWKWQTKQYDNYGKLNDLCSCMIEGVALYWNETLFTCKVAPPIVKCTV